MEQSRLSYLYRRYQSRQLNDAERIEWETIVQSKKYDKEIEELIDSEWQPGDEFFGVDSDESKRIYNYIIGHEQRKQPISRKLIGWLPYAAAIVLVLGVGFFALRNRYDQKSPLETQIADISPGGNNAFLTLSDGSVINLNPDESGILIGKDITYEDGSNVLGKSVDVESEMLQLMVPKGGTYAVTLYDGTKVWLNSGSKLKYPSRFDEDKRVVELEGEAFFEVSRVAYSSSADKQSNNSGQKVPFFVKTKTQIIEVLGTSFNVSAYTDDKVTATTLVEGAVKVAVYSTATSNTSNMPTANYTYLNPSEQSILADGIISKKTVDIKPYVAWKTGVFYFDDTRLVEAMSQLSRWYDVEIVYSGANPDTYFYGEISRSKNLAFVLEVLKTSGVNFKIINDGSQNKLIVL